MLCTNTKYTFYITQYEIQKFKSFNNCNLNEPKRKSYKIQFDLNVCLCVCVRSNVVSLLFFSSNSNKPYCTHQWHWHDSTCNVFVCSTFGTLDSQHFGFALNIEFYIVDIVWKFWAERHVHMAHNSLRNNNQNI